MSTLGSSEVEGVGPLLTNGAFMLKPDVVIAEADENSYN